MYPRGQVVVAFERVGKVKYDEKFGIHWSFERLIFVFQFSAKK
jgi:hypothetical protein